MNNITETIGGVKIGIEAVDKGIRWGSKTAPKRFFTVCLAAFVILGAYSSCLYLLLMLAAENSQTLQKKIDIQVTENRYQSVVDWANICIESNGKKGNNSDWYCNQAVEMFEQRASGVLPDLRKKIIENKAYGVMVIEMSAQLRGLEIERLKSQAPTTAQELLNQVVSGKGLAFAIAIAFVLYSLTVYLLLRYSRENGARTKGSRTRR